MVCYPLNQPLERTTEPKWFIIVYMNHQRGPLYKMVRYWNASLFEEIDISSVQSFTIWIAEAPSPKDITMY